MRVAANFRNSTQKPCIKYVPDKIVCPVLFGLSYSHHEQRKTPVSILPLVHRISCCSRRAHLLRRRALQSMSKFRGVQHEVSITSSTIIGSFSEVCRYEQTSCSVRSASHANRGESSRRGDNRDELDALIRTSDANPAVERL